MLHYNENKVAAEEASLLLASGFAGDISRFSFGQKLQRFEKLAMLNTRVKTNAIHISLNFDAQDKLDNEKLQQIAMAYMERIGFGDQPYLVYRHHDAAHTHVHIATINIRPDGSRIDTHGIGWKLSEPARIELEKEFGLVEAKGRNKSDQLAIKPAHIEKALYGKTPTKRAITNIVNAVIRDYHFTSLAEFNAVLKQFNVIADRGAEDTIMREKGGLIYSLIDQKGEPVGIPIKASAIYNKPTLSNLAKSFAKKLETRKPYREPLKQAIESAFNRYYAITKKTLVSELQQRNIQVLFRTNEQGSTYGVTYIDHRYKAVFNGSDLGKAYSAKALLERLSAQDRPIRQAIKTGRDYTISPQTPPRTHLPNIIANKQPVEVAPSIPRRKKKRKGQQQDQGMNL